MLWKSPIEDSDVCFRNEAVVVEENSKVEFVVDQVELLQILEYGVIMVSNSHVSQQVSAKKAHSSW